MRLFVTRPLPDAETTAGRLRAMGHEVLVQPLLEIVFSAPPSGMQRPAALLLTSQNGVRALARWPDASTWRDVPLFAAGSATARDAEAAGFADVRTGEGGAAALAVAVTAAMPHGCGPLVYPAARDRTAALEEELVAAGYDVRTVEAYRADVTCGLNATVRSAIANHAIDGVLLYSRRTAKAYADLVAAASLGEHIGNLQHFVLSQEVARGLGDSAENVRIAAHPDEDSLLTLIPRPR